MVSALLPILFFNYTIFLCIFAMIFKRIEKKNSFLKRSTKKKVIDNEAVTRNNVRHSKIIKTEIVLLREYIY